MVRGDVSRDGCLVCRKTSLYSILCCYVDGWLCLRVRQSHLVNRALLNDLSRRLGDRHGENILFEEGTGGVLHVDFNCLFDKVSCTRVYPAGHSTNPMHTGFDFR